MRKMIELQADRIEELLQMRGAPGYVTGGTATSRMVQFHVVPDRVTKVDAIKRLADDMAAALDVSSVRVDRRGAALVVEVPIEDPPPVALLPLLEVLDGKLPAITATVGIDSSGEPLCIRVPSPDVAHVLVSGTTGSGKTVLLRDMVLSLALQQSRRELALVLIDPRGGQAFDCFATLPHLAYPVVRRAEDAVGVLASLATLMERRDQDGESEPSVIVVIDELADLLMTAEAAIVHLTRLVQRGRGAGVHVVAATQKPTAAVLGPLVKANFPVRLVGKVTSSTDARVAAGWSGTGAERLGGRGDFIAVAQGRVTRFQAALVTETEIAQVMRRERWDSVATPSMLLRPAMPAPEPEAEEDPAAGHVDRLTAMGWDPSRSYRAACRALGEAEGGGPFQRVKDAVDRMRGATATATERKISTRPTGRSDESFLSSRNSGSDIRSAWLEWIQQQEMAT